MTFARRISILSTALILGYASFAMADHKGVAYVSNQDGGITVIDLDTLESTGNIDIQAKSPRGIGITADGKLLITANKDDSNISIIDTATRQVIKQVEVGKNPEFVRIYGKYAFISTEPSSKGGPPPKPGQEVKEEDDDAKVPARIAVVDLKKGKKVREIVGGPETEGIEFSKDGKKIIITNEADNTITVHNFATGKLLKTVSTQEYGNRPRGIKASPDGQYYVSTLEFSNKMIVLDKNFKVTRAIDTANAPYGISFNKTGDKVYVAASKDKVLQVFDTKTFEKLADIPTGNRCWHFTFTPDESQILMACGKSDAVIVIDVEKQEKVKEISDKEMPWGVVTYPKAMGSLDSVK
jgi:YVTN family beta-propeller protein